MLNVVHFFNTPQCLLVTVIISSLLKGIIIKKLAPQAVRSPSTQLSCILLIMVLVGSLAGELTWCIKLLSMLFFPQIPYAAIIFCIRLAWAFLILQYQALFLFIKSLIYKKISFSPFAATITTVSSIFFSCYLYLAFFNNELTTPEERHIALTHISDSGGKVEILLMHYTIFYIFLFLIIPTLYETIRKIKIKDLPKILHQQITVIFKYLLMPYFLTELLIAFNFECNIIKPYQYATVGISALLITYIVYYCIRHIMDLRFLNFTNHVESTHAFNFIDDFKIILEQLSCATNVNELIQITTTFLKQSFGIHSKKVKIALYTNAYKNSIYQPTSDTYIKDFLDQNPALANYLLQQKIILYDELLFSNFYQEEATQTQLINFMRHINAEIFLPIFERERIIGFILIESDARPDKLYNKIERDQFLVFASYLGNVIHLLQNRNLELLINQEKELKEELHKKNQEVAQYRESLRSFLKNNKQKEIGIIFYKNRRFIYSNQMAKDIIKCNVNVHAGHPISKALRSVAKKVAEYKEPQTMLVKDLEGNRFIISGVLNLGHNNVILTISHPDMADIITKQLALLKDPSLWDYLLYLETTKPGQLINQLIPGNGQTLLNFKISLLQTALSKKATLLEMPAADVMPMVELLHHINMREVLHSITLTQPTNPIEICAKIFGINPLFISSSGQKPLLEKLNGNGTLFIQSIEYLDLESQEYLAEFIQYGYYRLFKSNHRINSSVRIICSTNQNLQKLIEEGTFSKTLFNELKKTHIVLPSLQELSATELIELAHGYTQQALETHEFKNLLELSKKETLKLMEKRPVSLQELKIRVQHILMDKSKKNYLEREIQFNPAYEITDPELVKASRLGKHALRDHKIMHMLWAKFKNQNKVAAFLGVNRSSVNRRCKEYNLAGH